MPKVTIRQKNESASEAEARGHLLVMDRPEEKGGANQGMMGGEVLLCGLGGCFMSNLLAAAEARSIPLKNALLNIEGQLSSDSPSRYVAIKMQVSAEGVDDLHKLATIAERGCIVANTLKKSVDLSIEIA